MIGWPNERALFIFGFLPVFCLFEFAFILSVGVGQCVLVLVLVLVLVRY